ncbi:MAG: glycosyl transferase family protein [uncultured bacterium]|nr:MAG: glycosyl transferase family protein [uncultured bacterium]
MKNPLVTITIPAFNSGKTIERCLLALKRQSYKNIDINIIDGSTKNDKTYLVARKYEALHKFFPGSLLAARYEGVKIAKGKYTLIFDSDQIISNTAIEKAVALSENNGYDMVVFEEDVFKKDTYIEKLFACDRKLMNAVNDLSPYTGVIMPRFFKTKILMKSYSNIPHVYFADTGGPDHAIVYLEAYKLSNKIGIITNAVKHLEPSTLTELLKKFYRWGQTSVGVSKGKYSTLMKSKERFRTGLFSNGLIIESLGSILLLILKGVAFKTGYIIRKMQ